MRMTQRQLGRATLERQLLLERSPISASDAIGRLVGLQAQLPRPPFVGLWTRLRTFRREDLLDRIRSHEIVRATAMRGTLHLMRAVDYATLRAALQPGLARGAKGVLRNRYDEAMSSSLLAEAREFFARGPATFDAFRTHLLAGEPTIDERALAYIVRTHLPLVQCCTDDDEWGFASGAAFTLAEEWLGQPVPLVDKRPHELVRRYLAAFGPASPADAACWSGLSGLKSTFEDLREELISVTVGERELFDLLDAPRPTEDVPAPPRLLPDFDNFVLGHDDRSRLIADEYRPRLTTKNLQVRATYLIDGMVAGTWRTNKKGKKAELVLEPFVPIPKKWRRELEAEAEAALEFLFPEASSREIREEN